MPLADELFLPEGRTVLERIIRRQGARRHALVAALADGWRTTDGRPVDEDLVGRLLDHHGLARAFARREHDELLHALRAAGGLRSAAAARLGIDREALDAALARAGASAEAERIREARRGEARAKATLAERVRLLLTDPARLEDLGILEEFEDDLRRRLPEHVRAVGAAGGPLLLALGQSLSILPAEAQALLERLGVPLAPGRGRPAAGAGTPAPRARPRPGFAPAAAGAAGGMRPPRRPASGRAGPGPRPERRGPPGAPGSVGPPRDRRERTEGGFGPPRQRRDRKEGLGPPRERREGASRGFGSPRPDRKEGFGPPRERSGRPEGTRRPGPRKGPGRPGGAPPSGRPGGPRGKPPPRGPRRGGA